MTLRKIACVLTTAVMVSAAAATINDGPDPSMVRVTSNEIMTEIPFATRSTPGERDFEDRYTCARECITKNNPGGCWLYDAIPSRSPQQPQVLNCKCRWYCPMQEPLST